MQNSGVQEEIKFDRGSRVAWIGQYSTIISDYAYPHLVG